jgi:hypothetical protein
LGLYLSWLVRAGFLDAPPELEGGGESGKKRRLPRLEGGVEKAMGRTTMGSS